VFRLTPAQLVDFHTRLTELVNEMAVGPADPANSRYYGFALALYPTGFMQGADTDDTA
jgi:hypothetical protein